MPDEHVEALDEINSPRKEGRAGAEEEIANHGCHTSRTTGDLLGRVDQKITKAQELIATSRIARAQARLESARPYASEITRMLTTLAGAALTIRCSSSARAETSRRAGGVSLTVVCAAH